MAHDFEAYPELTNNQMSLYYFDSPHQQIMDNFNARVENVHDGDTIRVSCDFRDFSFPIRMSNLMAAELNEKNGIASRNHLKELIEGEEVEIIVNKNNRVGKWGRLLGKVMHRGFDIGDQMKNDGFAIDVDEEQTEVKELMLILDL